MIAAVSIVPPPDTAPETLEQLSTHPEDVVFMVVPPRGLDQFMARAEPCLRAMKFVVVYFFDKADADELDRRVARARARLAN